MNPALSLLAIVGAIPTIASADPVLLADSVADFSSTQGQSGWEYGYYNGNGSNPWTPEDFERMTDYKSAAWAVQEGPGGYWTAVADDDMHPNGMPAISGRQGDLHWAARRWTSGYTGTISVGGRIKDAASGFGDGVTAFIFVGGGLIYSTPLEASDTTGIWYDFQVDINEGETIDFVIAPNANALYDNTLFTAFVYEGVVGHIPAPAGVAVLGLGALVTGRRRTR